MKEIKLTQGKVALVDDEDYEELNKYKWHFNNMYAKHNIDIGLKRKTIQMHKIIINVPKGMFVDHIDGNGLNNQKNNLRLVSTSQNAMNQKVKQHSSKYKGVFWHKVAKKWIAQIRFNSKNIYLGLFEDENKAGLEYNKNAIKYFGEFAKLNEIKEN